MSKSFVCKSCTSQDTTSFCVFISDLTMASLGQLLGENKFLKLQANNKILCDVTGHEMSARGDVVQAYINGKKFKKELEWYKHDYSEFLPYIVEDKNNSKKLYCKLTRQTLNKIPEEVRKHMQGKRFKRCAQMLHIAILIIHALKSGIYLL